MNPNKSDANRLALALKNIHSEENLYKVPFFLGDKFADWHFKNAKEDQAAFEKHCSERNIRLGLLGNEQSELHAALKALYQEMIDKRTALVQAAYARLYENEIEPIQTPNFSISTKYVMPVPAYNAIPVIVQVAVKASQSSAEAEAKLKQQGSQPIHQHSEFYAKADRQKLSATEKGQMHHGVMVYPKTICPHCGKEGGGPAMKQWHFDNCPHKHKLELGE